MKEKKEKEEKMLLTINQVRGLLNQERAAYGQPPVKYQNFINQWKMVRDNHPHYLFRTGKCWLEHTDMVGPNYVFGPQATRCIIAALKDLDTSRGRRRKSA